jgi:hypothetical protein
MYSHSEGVNKIEPEGSVDQYSQDPDTHLSKKLDQAPH